MTDSQWAKPLSQRSDQVMLSQSQGLLNSHENCGGSTIDSIQSKARVKRNVVLQQQQHMEQKNDAAGNLSNFLRSLNLKDEEIDEIMRTGTVNSEVTRRLNERESVMLGLRLRDRQKMIDMWKRTAEEKTQEIEQRNIELKFKDKTIEERNKTIEESKKLHEEKDKLIEKLMAQQKENQEAKNSQIEKLRDEIKKFQTEFLETNKKTQSMIQSSQSSQISGVVMMN